MGFIFIFQRQHICCLMYLLTYIFISVMIESERSQRERLQDLAVFERLHGNPRKTSQALAVKKVSYLLCLLTSLSFFPLIYIDHSALLQVPAFGLFQRALGSSLSGTFSSHPCVHHYVLPECLSTIVSVHFSFNWNQLNHNLLWQCKFFPVLSFWHFFKKVLHFLNTP